MITSTLIRALEKAQSPRSVRMITRALEFTTGWKTEALVKGISINVSAPQLSSSDSPQWYLENGYSLGAILGGHTSYSGKAITPDAVFESAACYGIVKILGEDLGRLPFKYYERTESGVQEAFGQSLYGVLHDLPNPDMNAQAFVESLTARAALGMDGYASIDRDSNGNVLYLWPLNGTVTRDTNRLGRPFFVHKEGNAAEKTFASDRIFNLPGFSIDGRKGDEILKRARHILGLTLATQEYPARFFANDASPGIIIKRPAGLETMTDEDIAKMKEAWSRWHRGLNRAHEPAILQDGVDAMRLDPDHQKLQLIEQRKFQVVECCRLWRMSPHMLADLDRATFSNIEQLYNQHLTLTLAPWLKRWKQTVYRCLLRPGKERERFYAEHSVEDFQRGLFKDQAQGFSMLLEKGVYTINEVRRWYNLNPVEGGDVPHIQLNMQRVIDAANAATEDEEREQVDQDTREMASRFILPVSEVSKLRIQ